MKLFLPVALACLAAACAAPQPGTEAHQRQLAKEARENFYALKEKERKAAPPTPVQVAQVEERTEPPARIRLNPFSTGSSSTRPDTTRRSPTPKPSQSIASNNYFSRPDRPRASDETIYLYDMPHGPEPTSPRYRAYKIKYAHELAKRPEDLSSEEREWVRRHYRDY